MDFLRVGLPQALAAFGAGPFERGLSWTCFLLGLWCVLCTAEWISRFDLFRDDGLLSWRVMALRPQWVHRSALLAPLQRPRGVAALLAVRLACGVALLLPLAGWPRIGLLLALVATGWLFKLRNWLGEDGSDQMGQVVASGSVLTALGLQWQDLALALAGCLLVAGQLTISYFLAGVAKLVSYEWRSGRAVVGVMGTRAYGHDLAARLASASLWFPIAFCWFVIVTETVFPVFLFGPPAVLAVVLAAFGLFHVATALFMGLNTFVWAFVAAYPSVLVLNALLVRAW
ncbi:hypothetical protein HHL11_05530 [Ramlibacter sp. G-1-2-2]|uniref:HTTM-like domain-containing protein n=1 Tax=Ramlibacter agri TaxID=2728837 RepID=A0A848H0P4_9BURK|nr:hypothetical protein [Ramlibacter agri]NML43202.1 hypothetical protein [Ramlibacter agri]